MTERERERERERNHRVGCPLGDLEIHVGPKKTVEWAVSLPTHGNKWHGQNRPKAEYSLVESICLLCVPQSLCKARRAVVCPGAMSALSNSRRLMKRVLSGQMWTGELLHPSLAFFLPFNFPSFSQRPTLLRNPSMWCLTEVEPLETVTCITEYNSLNPVLSSNVFASSHVPFNLGARSHM
jgi:hypothetical protein